ncbi:hypothetical protein G3I31_21460 [Streptomyces sp. SID9913]|uniref:hypothetical protein n=1 Tax=Streptomyces sp. SID9913 TaxID=2706117 RepID=UPI0013DA244A|nr:hypothetical protein [Streptomyces sp. SID9913]NED20622.1 hypothetical protein [Streptomyces sp. SID9913]
MQAALDALLSDRAVHGRQDAERLATVVLLAKAPVDSSTLLLRAGEMARWLGFSESYVDHRVLPALRTSGAVKTSVKKDSKGYVSGLEWELLPLTTALNGRGSPLMLNKPEAATLLRLCERLFGPGWAPMDKPATPAGLLGRRRGRGAATARLALLQLALQARSDGSVRLVGGAVKQGHRRAAATVSRLLGCPVEDAEQILDDLIAEGVVEVHASSPESGAGERLVLPAVAAAHGREFGSELSLVDSGSGEEIHEGAPDTSGCAVCGAAGSASAGVPEVVLAGDGWVQEGFDALDEGFSPAAAGALRDQEALAAGKTNVDVPSDQGERTPAEGGREAAAGALHHASHAPVVEVDRSPSFSGGFSGEADRDCGGLPERAGAGEDQPDPDTVVEETDHGGQGGPLRGEQQEEVRGELGVPATQERASVAGPAVFVRPSSLPAGLEAVLAPVRSVWERIARVSTRRHIAAAVRIQLAALRGIVGSEHAEEALAERLERRLEQQMSRPVSDPVGWLLGRGLPQRQWCWSQMCDEGRRMDTGGECPSCQALAGDSRALRARITAQVEQEMPGAAAQEVRTEVEKRLHAAVMSEAAAQAVRRERQLAERQARERVIAQRRTEFAAAEEARCAAPCADCGMPDAAGLCPVCTWRQAAERALAEAVDLAVMARVDLTDPAVVAEATARCAADTQALLEQQLDRLRAEGAEEVALGFAAREIAEKIRDQRRESLHGRLMRSTETQAEADRAYATELRAHRHPGRALAEAAAERAADEALLRAVEVLRAERVRQLQAVRGERPAGPASTDWQSRFAQLVAQDLAEEDTAEADVPMAEAVNAA